MKKSASRRPTRLTDLEMSGLVHVLNPLKFEMSVLSILKLLCVSLVAQDIS